MKVALITARIQNFKSWHAAELAFPTEGFIFLGGENLVEPRLGANGSGKSSLWDAVCFCFYGSDALGNRASDLVTWGRKRPLVSVDLEIDGQPVTIDRWGNPNEVNVNDIRQDQDAIDAMLGFNRARFLQAILFAQKGRQFLDMTAPERGELMDSVLDLSYWAEKADLAAKLSKGYAEEIRRLELLRAQWEGRRVTPEAIEVADIRVEDWETQKEKRLAEHNDEIETLIKARDKAAAQAIKVARQIEKLPSANEFDREYDEKTKRLADIYQTRNTNATLRKQLLERNFYVRDHNNCEYCEQKIGETHRLRMHERNNEAITDLDREDRLRIKEQTELKGAVAKLEEVIRQRSDANRDARMLLDGFKRDEAENIRMLNIEIKHLERLLAEVNPNLAPRADLEKNRQLAEDEIAGLTATLGREAEEQRKMDYWRTGFKKVRLFLVKQALALLDIETANAASALGLADWRITYATEVETKSGSLKAGIAVSVDSPHVGGAWRLQSGGEEQRVRMAVSIGIASMISRMARASFNFEVWDEPTAHLSGPGIVDLMEALRDRAETTGRAVWVVDHHALSYGAFDETWVVRKTGDGSDLSRVTTEFG